VYGLSNQRPQWNEEVGMWSLGFEGQVQCVFVQLCVVQCVFVQCVF
jgi:hypothetical protein